MSNCGCEGSCPICRLGEVDNHKCGHCNVEFCPTCHGYIIGTLRYYRAIINPCTCEGETEQVAKG